MEGESCAHSQRGRALRPAVPRDDRCRRRQRLATAGSCVDADRVQAHGRARQRGAVLRSRAVARACERVAVGRQHDGLEPAQADERHFVAGTGWSARVSERPVRRRAVGDARESDDHGSQSRERVLAASERGSRAAGGGARRVQRRLPVRARVEPDYLGEPERADVRGRRRQQRMPSESRAREQHPLLVGLRSRTTMDSTSRSCSGRPRGATTACRTRTRSR